MFIDRPSCSFHESSEGAFNFDDFGLSFGEDSILEDIALEDYEEVNLENPDKPETFEFELQLEEDRSVKITLRIRRKNSEPGRPAKVIKVLRIDKELLIKTGHLVALNRDDYLLFKEKEACQGLINLKASESKPPQLEPICKTCEAMKVAPPAKNTSVERKWVKIPSRPNGNPPTPMAIPIMRPPEAMEAPPPLPIRILTSSIPLKLEFVNKSKIENFRNLPPHPDDLPVIIEKKSPVRDEQGNLMEEYKEKVWKSKSWGKMNLCGLSLDHPPPPNLLYQRKSCGANRKEQNELNPYELTDEDHSQITNGTLATCIRDALVKFHKTKLPDHNCLVWKAIMDRVVNLRQSNKHKKEKLMKEKWFTASVAVLISHYRLVCEGYMQITRGQKPVTDFLHILAAIQMACQETLDAYLDRMGKLLQFAREEAGRRPKKRAIHIKGESPFSEETITEIEREAEKEAEKEVATPVMTRQKRTRTSEPKKETFTKVNLHRILETIEATK